MHDDNPIIFQFIVLTVCQMGEKHVCASIYHPWLADYDQNLEEEDNRDHIIYTIRDPLSSHRFQLPPSHGRRVRGCFYGWVILSNPPHNDMLSLWNPVSCKIIHLPRLLSKDITQECCLSSSPDDLGSIFMVTTVKHAFVFCRLDRRRKRYKWVVMSYAKQMRSTTDDDSFVLAPNTSTFVLHASNVT
ncbi:hypothetical protein HanPI659440_Chr01g0031201 [Helianthus annuus]|nr:hypothetical protein HanPI659440_Chr01g0031201 [Helianthus annuus]